MTAAAPPRLMLAAPASGAGKTTVTLALLAALAARGLHPAAFKCGPDFLDPLFHRTVLGVRGCNLDCFLAPPEILRSLFRSESSEADIAVVEAAMGFYDGIGGTDKASAWRVARETETPVVLVVDPKGAGLTLAAVLSGLLRFREQSGIRGVLLNRCGERLMRMLTPVIEKECGLRVFGRFPAIPEAVFAERRLGLIPPPEIPGLRARVDALAETAGQTMDIPALLALAKNAPPLAATDGAPPANNFPIAPETAAPLPPPRIAVARDAAFCLYYEEDLALLRACGAELVPFSPLADGALPAGATALYLGGGWPELHAAALAANGAMRTAIRSALASGLPCVAGGGGFLYLQTALVDEAGQTHPMAGFLPGTSRNAGRPVRFGYQTLHAHADSLLLRAGETVPAHEFHYWDSDNAGADCTATKASDGTEWRSVTATPSLFAGFPHLYFRGNPLLARRFVAAAAQRRNQGNEGNEPHAH